MNTKNKELNWYIQNRKLILAALDTAALYCYEEGYIMTSKRYNKKWCEIYNLQNSTEQ